MSHEDGGGGTYSGPTPDQIGQAAFLLYYDELRDDQIARELGICRRTLARWKLRPDFRAAFVAASSVGSRMIDWHYAEMGVLELKAGYRLLAAEARPRRLV